MKTIKLIAVLALLNQITFSQTLPPPPPPPPPASGQISKADSLFNEETSKSCR
ncbi:MAG: hypothetical protein IPH69_12615 [Bacteroidales bacterium]|nr:hypothetical protein [Bacteroidales bacterium]